MKWQIWHQCVAGTDAKGTEANSPQDKEEQQLLQMLLKTHRFDVLNQLLLCHLQHALNHHQVVPTFWALLLGSPSTASSTCTDNSSGGGRIQKSSQSKRQQVRHWMQQLTQALAFMDHHFAPWQQLAQQLDQHVVAALSSCSSSMMQFEVSLCKQLRCLVFADERHKQLFQELFAVVGAVTLARFRDESDDGQEIKAFLVRFRDQLMALQWMELVQDAMKRIVRAEVCKCIERLGAETYDSVLYDQVENAGSLVDVSKWLDTLLARDDTVAFQWSEELPRYALEEFGRLRINKLFEIIKEFPDSAPAIRDLRLCLEKTHQHAELVTSFKAALNTRLLHPGANTSEILDIYISIIKAFRILDPKGVLLEALSEPIKQYLRQRKDTVRCIVTNLTDDQHGELNEELHKQNNMELIQQDDDSDDDEELSPDAWEPDPIEANPKKTSRSRNSDDILRLLVNIYGSKELVVNEYRLMLADKLLHNLEYHTDREVQTLELLKLRFGEDSLHNCAIMVRDVEESKRINTNLHQTIETSAQHGEPTRKCIVDAAIVSQHFWPPLQSEEFALHPSMASQIDEFQTRYHVFRNPRTLKWNNSLGSVQLSLEIDDVEREFTVSPFQATIIMFFDDQDRWQLEELAERMEVSSDSLLRHAAFWIHNGVLLLSGDRRYLTASSSFQEAGMVSTALGEDIETAVSSDAQAEEQLQVLESYIVGMLTNYGSLSIHRIHNMLSSLARSGAQPYDKTISGLSLILNQLVEKRRLVSVGGEFQLPTSGNQTV